MLRSAIELLFDEPTEAVLTELWERVRDNGLPSPLLAWGMRPHVSIALGAESGPELAGALDDWAARTAPIDVQLDVIGTFPGSEGVVFLAPVVDRALLDLHAGAHAALENHFGELDPRYRPDRWVPHCTVAVGLEGAQVLGVVSVCAEAPLPLRGRFTGVAIHDIEVDPACDGWDRLVASSYRGDVRLTGP